MAESELLELFEKANKAARKASVDAAGGVVDDAEESRCTEALKAISAVDITTSLLLSTQVGKRLRKLTKHASLKISSSAQEILHAWKKVVSSEAKKTPDASKSPTVYVKRTKVKVEVVEATSQHPSPTITTTATPLIPKAGGDSARDWVREMLVEALGKARKEAAAEDLEHLKSADDVVHVAVAVENALFGFLGLSKGKEKAKYRSIMFNMKDEKNPDFRRRVLLGSIKPEAICAMTSDEMASDERKKETESIKSKAMFECERGMQAVASTDQFKCGKCGQRKTTYFQMQTRSADEPMTTFVSCLNCTARWKF